MKHYTIKEAAEILGVTEQYLRNRMAPVQPRIQYKKVEIDKRMRTVIEEKELRKHFPFFRASS